MVSAIDLDVTFPMAETAPGSGQYTATILASQIQDGPLAISFTCNGAVVTKPIGRILPQTTRQASSLVAPAWTLKMMGLPNAVQFTRLRPPNPGPTA